MKEIHFSLGHALFFPQDFFFSPDLISSDSLTSSRWPLRYVPSCGPSLQLDLRRSPCRSSCGLAVALLIVRGGLPWARAPPSPAPCWGQLPPLGFRPTRPEGFFSFRIHYWRLDGRIIVIYLSVGKPTPEGHHLSPFYILLSEGSTAGTREVKH